MQHLAETPRGITPADLARSANLSRATAFRVLKTLQAKGMAEQIGNVYVAGPQLLRLATCVLDSSGLRAAAQPILRRLSARAGQTAHLAVRAGDRGVILDVCDGPDILRVASRSGTLIWLHCAATGKAILSTMEEEDARQTLERAGYPALTERTIQDWDEMKPELRRVLRRGYAVDDREYNDDVRCVAAPVLMGEGTATAAIGVTGPAAVVTNAKVPEVAGFVCEAAAELARRLYGEPQEGGRA